MLFYVPLLLFCLHGSRYFCTVNLFFIGVVLSNRVVIFVPLTHIDILFHWCGVFFYSNGKYFVMFVLRLIFCYYSFCLSIRIWIFFVLFLHIVILCFISVFYSNCHVCNMSQVWANKTSLTPMKVSGRVFVLGVSICLFLRFSSVIFYFYLSCFPPYVTCFVLSSRIMVFLLFIHISHSCIWTTFVFS